MPHPTPRTSEPERPRLRSRLRAGWLAVAGRFGAVQTLVLLAMFYLVLVGPVALGTLIGRRDFLGKRGLHHPGTAWRDADTANADLERAKLTT